MSTFDPGHIEKLRLQWVTAPRYDEKPAFDALYDALFPAPVRNGGQS